MLNALLDTDTGSDGVLEGVEGEAEGREAVHDFVEELTALFKFEIVGTIHLSLVDGAAHIGLLGLAIATADIYIENEDIMYIELLFFNMLIECFFVDDDLYFM